MSNYKIVSTKNEPRVELKDALGLSGCELSINELPANVSVPFVHSHKQNEELYLVLKGGGALFIDGEEKAVKEGDAIRVDPAGKRCFKAARRPCVAGASAATTTIGDRMIEYISRGGSELAFRSDRRLCKQTNSKFKG